MPAAPIPPEEAERQQALDRLNIVDTALEERFERVTRLASRLLGVPVAAITLIDGDRQWFKSVQGLDGSPTSRDESFCAHTILGDEPLIVEDATKDARFRDNPSVLGEPQIRFYAGCPVHSPEGFRIGALCVVDRQPRRLTPAQLEDLRDLTAMVEIELKSNSLAAAQVRMNEELAQARRAVLLDPLTRLWNRAGGEEFLKRQHELAVRQNEKFCLAVLDVDHFKKVNDTHGHHAGDEVLREVARRILRSIRPSDFACRMGGEEFMLMIADPSGVHALVTAQRVRDAIRSSPVVVEGTAIHVTASIGLASFDPAAATTPEEVIRLADACLYRAKQTGRDKIISHIEQMA